MFKKKKNKRPDELAAIVYATDTQELIEKMLKLKDKYGAYVKSKPKFNIDEWPGKYIMYFENQEDLLKFYDYLHSVGRRWYTGSTYKEFRPVVDGIHRRVRYLYFNNGTYSYENDPFYKIINFKDFDWSDINMRKTKFNVGDKVKVIGVTDHRCDYNGKIFTIRSINPNKSFVEKEHYGIKGGCFVVYADELKLVESAPFTKADLKDCMVVEIRGGGRYLVIGTRMVNEDDHLLLGDYREDLTDDDDMTDFDIVKVYEINSDYLYDIEDVLLHSSLNLIWERTEVKKEPKYKVGDRVRVRSDLIADKKYDPPIFTNNSMVHNYAGKSCFISEVDTTEKDGVVRYKLEGCCWYWTEGMFEGLVEYEEMTVAEIEKQLGYKVKIVDGE